MKQFHLDVLLKIDFHICGESINLNRVRPYRKYTIRHTSYTFDSFLRIPCSILQ